MALFGQKIMVTQERRPCIVNGRRAMFHRWADNARPVTPRGMEQDETADHYQLYTVGGIVEYYDGTVERVWPSDIRFIDGGGFSEIAWPEEDLQDE